MTEAQDQLAFWKAFEKLETEREAAFKVRKKDPARWQKAKHAYAEFRTAVKVLGGRQTEAGAGARVVPETAGLSATGADSLIQGA